MGSRRIGACADPESNWHCRRKAGSCHPLSRILAVFQRYSVDPQQSRWTKKPKKTPNNGQKQRKLPNNFATFMRFYPTFD